MQCNAMQSVYNFIILSCAGVCHLNQVDGLKKLAVLKKCVNRLAMQTCTCMESYDLITCFSRGALAPADLVGAVGFAPPASLVKLNRATNIVDKPNLLARSPIWYLSLLQASDKKALQASRHFIS